MATKKTTTTATKKSATPSKTSGNSQTAAKKSAGDTEKKSASGAKSGSGAGTNKHRSDLEKIMKDMMKDIYWAEKHLQKALGKLAKNASSKELSDAFLKHQEQTGTHIERVEQAFEMIGAKAQAKKCPAMEGLIEEANEEIEEYEKGPGRDAAIIVASQKAEHYEIAAYGSLRTFASTLGYNDLAALFETTLQEEADTDELLTTLAHTINEDAVNSDNESA